MELKGCDYNIVIPTAEMKCRKCFSRNVSVEYTDVVSKHKFRCIVNFSLTLYTDRMRLLLYFVNCSYIRVEIF